MGLRSPPIICSEEIRTQKSIAVRRTETAFRQVLMFCSSLAPGASNLIRYLSGPDVPSEDAVDPRKLISDLTVQDWTNIVKAFNRWPFAPKVCLVSLLSFQHSSDEGVGSFYWGI